MSRAPTAVFIDTSFFYAVLEPADANHPAASELVSRLGEVRSVSYSTWDVLYETATLLLYRSSVRLALRFLDEVAPRIKLVEVDPSIRAAALASFRRFNGKRGPRISLCDALTFQVVRRVLERTPVLTFDRGLRSIGLEVLPH